MEVLLLSQFRDEETQAQKSELTGQTSFIMTKSGLHLRAEEASSGAPLRTRSLGNWG